MLNKEENKEVFARLMVEFYRVSNPHTVTKLKANKRTLELLRRKQGNLTDLLKLNGLKIESKDGLLFLVGKP